MSDIKKEAEDIIKRWNSYANYLDDSNYESGIDKFCMHDEFVSYMGGKLFTDKELVKEICKTGQNLLSLKDIKIADFCNEELRNDRATALAMVISCNKNFELINQKFKDDKEFVLEALQEQNVFFYISERLKDDEQVVSFAIKQNPKIIGIVPDRFKTDKILVLEILKKDNYIIEFLHQDLTKDLGFLLDCWKIVETRSPDSPMILHNHAQIIIRTMSDEFKPLFNHVYLGDINNHLNEQMLVGFNRYLLNKELTQELNISNKQVKKIKI